MCARLFVRLTPSSCPSLSIVVFACVCVCLVVWLGVCVIVYLFVDLFVCLFVRLFMCLFSFSLYSNILIICVFANRLCYSSFLSGLIYYSYIYIYVYLLIVLYIIYYTCPWHDWTLQSKREWERKRGKDAKREMGKSMKLVN